MSRCFIQNFKIDNAVIDDDRQGLCHHYHHHIDRVSIRKIQLNSKLDRVRMDFGIGHVCLVSIHIF